MSHLVNITPKRIDVTEENISGYVQFVVSLILQSLMKINIDTFLIPIASPSIPPPGSKLRDDAAELVSEIKDEFRKRFSYFAYPFAHFILIIFGVKDTAGLNITDTDPLPVFDKVMSPEWKKCLNYESEQKYALLAELFKFPIVRGFVRHILCNNPDIPWNTVCSLANLVYPDVPNCPLIFMLCCTHLEQFDLSGHQRTEFIGKVLKHFIVHQKK